MRLIVPLLAFSLLAIAQPPTPIPAPPAAPTPLPSFFMLGGEATASTTPRPGGFAAFGTPIASDKLSWSAYQAYFSKGKPVSTATTGVAQKVCRITIRQATATCWLVGAVGPGQTGTSTNLALNGGGGVSFENVFRWPSLLLWVGALQNKSGSTNVTQVMIAVGRTF
jgi:hypothetical protein